VLPFVFLAGGAVLLWRVLSSAKSTGRTEPAVGTEKPAVEQDEYVRKLEEELKKRQ
jgi:hypothetical protein